MATLPDAQAQGERRAPQAPMGTAQYQSRTGMEEAPGAYLSQAGNEIQQAGEIVRRANLQQDQLMAQDAANRLNEWRNHLEFDPGSGFKNAQGSAAVGQQFRKDQQQRFSDAMQGINDSLENDQQKKFFQQHAQVLGLQYQSALLQHQSQQTENFNRETADSGVKLQLRDMGARPLDELNFQTGLSAINGIIDQEGARRHLPPKQIEELKGQYRDAAYTTRILSVLDNDPYLAGKMLDMHIGELGPASQVHLKDQVVKGVKLVQQRDLAQGIVSGRKLLDPQDLYPAIQNKPPLANVVKSLESGGRRYDDNGNLLTSQKGAQGEMQVMPATAKNPGYGVRPAKDDSPEELARVGGDYLGAMTARYQDPALILAAYNAGPGAVDKWIQQYGDPRAGQIRSSDWAAKIPFKETKDYVANGLKKINVDASSPGAPASTPTANELKTRLPAMIDEARQAAQRMYPNDPVFADSVAARTQAYANTIIAQQETQQAAARDMLTRGLVGTKPDGSDRPQNIDELLAPPRMKDAWNQATPETQLAIQGRFAKGEKGWTPDGIRRYDYLHGLSVADPEKFLATDFTREFGHMPDAKVVDLINLRDTINRKDAAQQSKDLNFQRAKSWIDDILKPVRLGRSAKPNSSQAKESVVFYGQLEQLMEQYHNDPKNNRWPDQQTTRQMAASLLANVKVPGTIFGGAWPNEEPLYKAKEKGETPVIPEELRTKMTKALTKANRGVRPTEEQIQANYELYLRQPQKAKQP